MTDFPKPPDGGPAFPINDIGIHGHHGMSLRDWFAGQALTQSVDDYGSPEIGATRGQRMNRGNPVLPYSTRHMAREEIIARQAYLYADAMIAARAEKAKP